MSAEQTLAFVAFAVVAAITPGPSNVMLMATGALAGVARGLPCLAGVGAGMAAMMFAVALGLGTAVLGHAGLVEAIRWLGAALLLWLAWKIAAAPFRDEPEEARPAGFVAGFAFQWLNPKSWLVSAAAAGAHLRADAGALAQASWIAAVFFAVALSCGFVWLAFGTAMRALRSSARRRRAFDVAMGALLAGSVLLLL